MLILGALGLAVAALAISAFVGERRSAGRQGRRMRLWFVATDVIGGLFGLVVAAIAFTA